jgi:hypothetical protein
LGWAIVARSRPRHFGARNSFVGPVLNLQCGPERGSYTAVVMNLRTARIALMSLSLLTMALVPVSGSQGTLDGCTFIPKAELERLVGYELRDGKAKDVSPGMSQCAFETPPGASVKRRFDSPALPAAAGFSSLTVTTFPTTVATFAQSRKTMADASDVAGVGDSAFLSGPAMIFARVGTRGFSIRVYVDNPTNDASRTRLREVMLSLGRAGVARIK